jgi:cytochrome P450
MVNKYRIETFKILTAFLEILRLYPVVPFNSRTSIKATTLPNKTGNKPWFVPARTRVTYSVFLMHRRTDLWGPDGTYSNPLFLPTSRELI